jgi:hypothetical protein
LYKGKYLYSDYDLYDVIVVGHERANLAVVGKRDGADDYRPARLFPIENFVNGRIGAEMVHHGGQFQYSEHTNDIVEVFRAQGRIVCWSRGAVLREELPTPTSSRPGRRFRVDAQDRLKPAA